MFERVLHTLRWIILYSNQISTQQPISIFSSLPHRHKYKYTIYYARSHFVLHYIPKENKFLMHIQKQQNKVYNKNIMV